MKHVAVSLALVGVPFILIVRQPDLGTSLLILASGAFVLFMAGLRWRWIISVLAAAVPAAVAMWFFFMHDYQKQRVLTFLTRKAIRWAPAGTSFSQRQPSVRAAFSAKAGCWALSLTWTFCRKATPTSSSRCWVKSSVW